MKNWNVRKTIVAREDMPEHHRLAQSLSWPHLIALGVGAIVGTGILTLTGVGAAKAGPAVILSFAIAGVICAFAALAYAEMATMYPGVGQRLHLQLHRVRRADRLDRRLVADPRIQPGRQRGRGRLVGLCRGFLDSIGAGLPRGTHPGARAGRDRQPARHLHHRGGRRPADLRHARERQRSTPSWWW